MNYASPFWQQVLVSAAVFYLLFEIWRGWRRGIIRSGFALLALLLAGGIGLFIGQFLTRLLGNFIPFPTVFVVFFFGIGAAIAVYFILWFCSALLFKRTEHQRSGLIRLIFGLGGAFFGFIFGLTILWAGITAVRTLGTFAEINLNANRGQNGRQTSVDTCLVTLKQSLELGPAGKIISSIDILSPQTYDLLFKIGRVSSDENAMVRFLNYPGTQALLATPRIQALLQDDELITALQKKNYLALLTNKKLISAVNDPVLLQQVKKFDLEKALDYALQPSKHSPSNP